ncbi:hypothetical protein CDEST_10326 [Colletotrichum destructivum]|uniref:Uncharacterized protein n=1 Tax=Colletotrichum destructivum TaxID=34406 RepID=A0AAX4IQ84_9PEZI|nr:hypothetical protein CDEST_10326 [Colletotrichum destructivum]
MAILLAPYNPSMQLGSGFNSFTQELCISNAVVRGPIDEANAEKAFKCQAQEVTYRTSVIDTVTDITSAMNINPVFSIKYDIFDAKGKGDFINTSKVKESDISFLTSVKVVNEVVEDYSLTKFDYIPHVKAEHFAEVYGDSFISGFQEGGEFTAVISIKAKDRQKASSIKARWVSSLMTANFLTLFNGGKYSAAAFFKEKFTMGVDGESKMDDMSLLEGNETIVSVTWTGGGQEFKRPEDGWTFETMRAAALKFPDMVARTPMRTKAILTKYSALQSFHSALAAGQSAIPLIPSYGKAEVYIAILQEAYIDFKIIAKNLQVLSFNVGAGTEELVESPAARRMREKGGDAHNSEGEDKNQAANSADEMPIVTVKKVSSRATRPYEPSLAGLEVARRDVRFMLSRIVAEVEAITRKPELAVDRTRPSTYPSPSMFKELLPESRPVQDSAGVFEVSSNTTGDLLKELGSLDCLK